MSMIDSPIDIYYAPGLHARGVSGMVSTTWYSTLRVDSGLLAFPTTGQPRLRLVE